MTVPETQTVEELRAAARALSSQGRVPPSPEAWRQEPPGSLRWSVPARVVLERPAGPGSERLVVTPSSFALWASPIAALLLTLAIGLGAGFGAVDDGTLTRGEIGVVLALVCAAVVGISTGIAAAVRRRRRLVIDARGFCSGLLGGSLLPWPASRDQLVAEVRRRRDPEVSDSFALGVHVISEDGRRSELKALRHDQHSEYIVAAMHPGVVRELDSIWDLGVALGAVAPTGAGRPGGPAGSEPHAWAGAAAPATSTGGPTGYGVLPVGPVAQPGMAPRAGPGVSAGGRRDSAGAPSARRQAVEVPASVREAIDRGRPLRAGGTPLAVGRGLAQMLLGLGALALAVVLVMAELGGSEVLDTWKALGLAAICAFLGAVLVYSALVEMRWRLRVDETGLHLRAVSGRWRDLAWPTSRSSLAVLPAERSEVTRCTPVLVTAEGEAVPLVGLTRERAVGRVDDCLELVWQWGVRRGVARETGAYVPLRDAAAQSRRRMAAEWVADPASFPGSGMRELEKSRGGIQLR